MTEFSADYLERFPLHFVDRDSELAWLAQALAHPGAAVAVIGPPGIGKTTLVNRFLEDQAEMFPVGRLQITCAEATDDTNTWLDDARRFLLGPDDGLIITIDDAQQLNKPALGLILKNLIHDRPEIRLIVMSRGPVPVISKVLELGPLPPEQIERIWQAYLLDLTPADRQILHGIVKGNPLTSTVLAPSLRDGVLTIKDLATYLSRFTQPGLVGVNGQPIQVGTETERIITSDLSVANEHFLRKLQATPDLVYQLSSRQFEELVAELFARLGYTVQLTRKTRDGGKDLYFARRDALGSFMFLVECKKFSPSLPVGVGLVRQLYGVVQAEKATAGILATTSYFTKGALRFQESVQHQLSLADYVQLRKWLSQALTGGSQDPPVT